MCHLWLLTYQLAFAGDTLRLTDILAPSDSLIHYDREIENLVQYRQHWHSSNTISLFCFLYLSLSSSLCAKNPPNNWGNQCQTAGRGIWVSSPLCISTRQSQWLEPQHCACCRARTVSLRCSCIGFSMGVLRSLPGCSCPETSARPCCPLERTWSRGRVLAESLAGVPVPLRNINACKGHQCLSGASLPAGMSVAARVPHFSRGTSLAGAAGSTADSDPYDGISPCLRYRSLFEVSVPGRDVGPCGVGPRHGVGLAEDSREWSMQIPVRVQSIDVTSSRRRQPGT